MTCCSHDTTHDTPHDTTSHTTRRNALRRLGTAGATALAATTMGAAFARPLLAHARPYALDADLLTPDEALKELYAGNQRFVAGQVMAPNRNMMRLKEVAAGQKPFAAFLGCADSRVPIEIVFDQGFGDVFVTRIAGNVADPAIIGSLEFGTLVLGAKVLYILGHSKCGAVSATIAGQEVPGQISTLYQHIRRAAKDAKGDLAQAIARNVQIQAEILQEASPVIARLMKEGKLKIAGGVYDLDTGVVTPLSVAA
jgi:carbonic anhydrase